MPGAVAEYPGNAATAATESLATHDCQNPLDAAVLQAAFMADEYIVLGHHGNEIQSELARRGLDSKAHIRHAAGHIGSDCGMRELHLRISLDLRALDSMLRQQIVKQDAGARLRVAIHEPHAGSGAVVASELIRSGLPWRTIRPIWRCTNRITR